MVDSGRFRSGKAGIFLLLAVALLLPACAGNVYMGIPLTGRAGDPTLRSLAQRAAAGDKWAQLDLGIRYEEGRGVPPDAAKAERLYRLAARDSGGTIWIYSPPVRGGASGRVIPVDGGPLQPGLTAAKVYLDRLANSGGRQP